MSDTKLDADLAAYEERHEKLERFFWSVIELCERADVVHSSGIVYSHDLREAAKELL